MQKQNLELCFIVRGVDGGGNGLQGMDYFAQLLEEDGLGDGVYKLGVLFLIQNGGVVNGPIEQQEPNSAHLPAVRLHVAELKFPLLVPKRR